MKKTIERVALGFLIREMFYICIAAGGVGMVFWLLFKLEGVNW